MANLAPAAEEVFQILQSFDYTVMLYDEGGNRVSDPTLARRFLAKSKNILVSLNDDGDNSGVRMIFGKSTDVQDILGLIDTLRTAATKYNLLFSNRKSGKVITSRDAASGVVEAIDKEHHMIEVFEGMYGTSRSSYLKLENARMIVRHSAKIDDSKHGARGRCVESIFIENPYGERMLFPTNHLAPARAMTQHVNQGGNYGDLVGQQIIRMANDFASLAGCTSHIIRNTSDLNDAALVVREACMAKRGNLKKTFEKMYRPSGYISESQRLQDEASRLDETEDSGSLLRIDEMRNLLNVEGVSLDEALVEAAAKAVLEMGVDVFEKLETSMDDEDLSEKNPVVKELAEWIRSHDINQIISEDDGDEEIDTDDMIEMPVDEDMKLTREDILLPSKDQETSLKREVCPIAPAKKSDDAHLANKEFSRLRLLSGLGE